MGKHKIFRTFINKPFPIPCRLAREKQRKDFGKVTRILVRKWETYKKRL